MYSPVLVHYTKRERKTCCNLLEFFLRNVTILIMVVIFENRLDKVREKFKIATNYV